MKTTDWLCLFSLPPLYHFSTEGRSTNPQTLKQEKEQHKRFHASMLSTPRENGSISVDRSSVWETTKICGYVGFRVPRKAGNPRPSLPEGLQVNLKAPLSIPFRANPFFAPLRF